MPFDENIQPDVNDVLQAAAMLDISEYHLFHLAYKRWHGDPAEESVMEPIFVAYMFDLNVPPWVRHFSRLVQRLNRMGKLDRLDLGIPYLPWSPDMARRGIRYSIIIVSLLVGLIVLAEFAGKVMGLSTRCLFPPCY
ncbi:MAG: hypothetical protein DRQ37_01040 [Gammaproteobacteria bacterium]|nr:MAG: hypothetical protein DRQ37_01040 [Gammaproteobacteria bacterium]